MLTNVTENIIIEIEKNKNTLYIREQIKIRRREICHF